VLTVQHLAFLAGGDADNPDGDGKRLEQNARQAVEEFLEGRCIDLSPVGGRALGVAGLAPVSVVPVMSDYPFLKCYLQSRLGKLEGHFGKRQREQVPGTACVTGVEHGAKGADRHVYIPRTQESLTCWG
jgi:hypothetical protein